MAEAVFIIHISIVVTLFGVITCPSSFRWHPLYVVMSPVVSESRSYIRTMLVQTLFASTSLAIVFALGTLSKPGHPQDVVIWFVLLLGVHKQS